MEQNALTILNNATQMLAEVRTIDDAKQLMDVAAAAEYYAKKHKLGSQAVAYAKEIKERAKDKLGAFWKVAEKNQGAAAGGEKQGPRGSYTKPRDKTPTLADLGMSKKVASEAVALNSLPEPVKQSVFMGEKTLTQAKREVKKEQISQSLPTLPTGKYRVIYADPPWKYHDEMTINPDSEDYGPADAHYPQMTIAELCEMPIKNLAEDNAVLFLWTTSPLLESSFKVIKAWGFQYKTSFVWDKIKHNMGHYNSVRHEFLLLCTLGSCTPDINKLFPSVQRVERSKKHSEKPREFRTIIETLYTSGERLELFARTRHEGWTSYGNELSE